MGTPREERRGRPPEGSGQAKALRLGMRAGGAEKEGFRAAAELAGPDMSARIRERPRQAAWKEPGRAGRPAPLTRPKS